MMDKTCWELAEYSRVVKKWRIEEGIFFEDDGADVQPLHNDTIVATLNIDNSDVHHVLIDSGSASQLTLG